MPSSLLYFLVILCCLCSVVFLQSTVTVNVAVDDGVSENDCLIGGSCSLRDAWNTCLNISSPSAECIVFLPHGAEIVTNSTKGPLVLEQHKKITLASISASIRSDGLADDVHHSRFIYFLAPTDDNQTALSLKGLTLSGYGQADTDGGAIYVNGGILLKITNCAFVNNTGNTGGTLYIAVNAAGVQIADSHFESGHAYNGGAIGVEAFVTNMIVENCSFSECHAFNDGGAIYLGRDVQNVLLERTLICKCSADGVGGGLAIGSNNSDVLVRNSRFLFNHAGWQGGSISLLRNNRNVSIENVEIGHSSAISGGGGIVVDAYNDQVSIEQLWAHDCSIELSGGAIQFISHNMDARIHNSRFENCNSYSGGAIFVLSLNHRMSITHTTFRRCRGILGGSAVMVFLDNDHLLLDHVTAEHCSGEDGGALHMWSDNDFAVIRNSVFTNCSVPHSVGGALSIYSRNRHMRVENTNITNCAAFQGGAIALDRNCDNFTVTHSRIENCSAQEGGALFINSEQDRVLIYKTQFINNQAIDGGAIYSNPLTKQIILAGSKFLHNTATQDGGAVFLNGENEQFLISDTETAQRVHIVETPHPNPCLQTETLLLHIDPAATAFHVQIDSQSVIGGDDVFRVYDGNGQEMYSGTNDHLWPGVRRPPLVVQGSMVIVALHCLDLTQFGVSTELYGLRVIATPVLAEPGEPTVFSFNKAGGSGGAIAAPYSAAFGRIVNTKFAFNSAGTNGGAIALNSGSTGVTMESIEFSENEAGISGGAVSLGSNCDSTDFLQCNFELNSAGDSGGALAMIYGNGATAILIDGTLTRLKQCTFANNSADLGGALYIDRENVAVIQQASFVGNEALDEGGAICAGADNDIILVECSIEGNTAARNGGGLVSKARNSLGLIGTSVRGNTAGKCGGGVYTSDATTVWVSAIVSIEDNIAAVAGGGLASFACPLWDRDPGGSLLVLAGNRAQRGSALYIKALVRTDASDEAGLRDMVIADNVATVGGTVYWLYDSDMTSEPEGVNSSSVVWAGNVALYGERVATQAIQVQGPAEYTVEVFGQALDPPLKFRLQDLYGQEMSIQGPTLVAARLEGNSASNCSGRTPFLSGTQQMEMNGTAQFTRLEANCAPDGDIKVEFTASLLDLTEVAEAGSLADYAVAKTVTMTYRSCRRGEYIQDGQCVTCPTGTYSLEYPVTQDTACVDCTGKSGVVTCYGDVIEVSGGYWRRHNTSEAVLDCLGDANGCAGGEGTGDALCEEGYEGPLCAVCADGYYSSNGVCELCSGDTKLSTTTIVFVGIAGVVIVVAIFMFYAKCLDGGADEDLRPSPASERSRQQRYTTKTWIQQQFQDMRAQLKIVITTYQIVSEVPSNLNVKFPSSFTSFLKVFAVFNLNVISVVPFACTEHYTFIDKLVATTLFPIGLSLLLALLCAVDIARLTYMRITCGKDTNEKITAVKDQYVTYFFFLTYLVLPSVSTTIFQTFLCTNVDPRDEDNDEYDSYLIADMSISCTSSYYYRGVGYAVAMLLVYVVGIPLMYFLLLYYNRSEIAGREDGISVPSTNEPAEQLTNATKLNGAGSEFECAAKGELSSSAKRLSFLWDAYEPQFWYWEVVETTRRLMLTAVLSVCGPGTSAQSIFAVLLGLLYIKLYGFFAPYEKDNDDVVAEVGQFQIFFSFLGALIYQNSLLGSEWNDAVSVVLILINGAVTLLFIYYGMVVLREDWEERQEYLRNRKAKDQEVEICRVLPTDDEYFGSHDASTGPTKESNVNRTEMKFEGQVGDENAEKLQNAEGTGIPKVLSDYFWS